MNKLVGLLVVLAASHAVAAPVALDYAASDASCIDGARFSDEVSAKLGFVPWDPTAGAKIRIRVQRDGEQFTGTFRNVDGSAKIVDGKTCVDVTASLVITVAMAVDSTVKPAVARAPVAPPSQPMAEGMVPVTFLAVDGRRVSIAVQKGAGFGMASNGVAVAAAYFDGLCTSPCTAGLPHGRNFLTFTDPDDASIAGGNYLIDKPTTLTLEHKSRRGTRIGLVVGGAAAAGLGGLWLAQADCKMESGCLGPVLGGSTVMSLGLTAMLLSLFVHDTFSVSQSP
jgi:hypothetical protein